MSEEEETKKKKSPEVIQPEPQIWSMLGVYYGDNQPSISYIIPTPTDIKGENNTSK